MRSRRSRVVAAGAAALGVVVILVAGVMLQRPIRERWYISRLDTQHNDEREEAAERLGQLGSVKAIPHLLQALTGTLHHLEEESGISPFASITGFCSQRSTGERFISTLQARLRGAENLAPESRRKMRQQLIILQKEDAYLNKRIETVTGELLNKSYDALIKIAKRESEAAVPFLIRELENENWQVRWITVQVLGELGSEAAKARELIEKESQGENPVLRHAATRALTKIQS